MSAAERLEVKHNYDTRLALLEQSVTHINETMQRIEQKIELGFQGTDKRLEKMDLRLDKFNDRLWTNFLWILSTLFTLTTLVCGIMAKGFGWFN